ncbi:MAG: fibrobacter succinogenes major paralogous domain-containing protein [Fibromonadales bacterium]|nr:fibrobacter succinogenes major paralogous domain-containing protein [Fibromonadales bacterium]
MKKVVKIGLAALMVLTIGACDREKSVKIGNQTWMSANLNDASKGGVCYDNKPENCEKYGRLYTWDEATKACPKGWHLPSNAEWEVLAAFAGGMDVAGGKLKAKTEWERNGNGSDEYGFSALPGGFGRSNGIFNNIGNSSNWWTATEYKANDEANTWRIQDLGSKIYSSQGNKSVSRSVRCIKD